VEPVTSTAGLVPIRSKTLTHGQRACYLKGCRCEPCVQANREYKNAHRAASRAGSLPAVRNDLPTSRLRVEESWREAALCVAECRAGRAEHGWWARSDTNTDAAIEICDRCQVRADCLRWALELPEPVGIWGGLTARERNGRDEMRGRPRNRRVS
jgi:WhiB family redox-sensing transcriptional regulator